MSPSELLEKKEKGICYKRDQKYTPTHRCRSHFLLLLGIDYDDGQLLESDLADSHPDEDIPGDISSLNALMGHPYVHAVDHYPIHGPARLPFKWKENVG